MLKITVMLEASGLDFVLKQKESTKPKSRPESP